MTTTTNFRKSFRPSVRLPRDGKPCKHSRHFRHCARVVVSKLDFLAAQDREQFVWAGAGWFNLNCCDWETKEPFSPSMIRAVFELLRTKQIITRAEKMRNRTSYRGWVVTQHSAITKTEGEWCVFCEKPGAPTGGETGAPTGDILVKTGGETGGVPGKTGAQNRGKKLITQVLPTTATECCAP